LDAPALAVLKVMTRVDFEQSIEESWHANAGQWTGLIRDQRIESRRLATDAAIVNAIIEQSPRRMLDVGCGEGWLARRIADRGVAVTGFDVSPTLVAHAREHAGNYLELGYPAFAQEPQRVGTDYDVVVCNFSLLGRDIAPVLRACRAVSAPGGKLLIQTVHPFPDSANAPYIDGWREETFRSFDGDFTPMPWFFRTIGTWISQVTAAGFCIIDVREPLHPETRRPLSLLIIAEPGNAPAAQP
jgi:2-polyprenyl-3-methyl-5-hydroxy-6-metoxy-1,4-benzoquinol methylase